MYVCMYIKSAYLEEKLKHSLRRVLGDYLSIANCLTKVCARFRGMIENFRGSSAFLFIFSTISRGTLVGKHCCRATVNPTQLFARCVLGVLSPGIKQPGREANHSPPCIGEVNNASCPPHALTVCTCTSSLLYPCRTA